MSDTQAEVLIEVIPTQKVGKISQLKEVLYEIDDEGSTLDTSIFEVLKYAK